jgi:hypothetical protein
VKERIVPLLQWAAMAVWDPSLYSVKVLIQSVVPEPFYCFERERGKCHVTCDGTFLSGWGPKRGCPGATLRNGTKRLQPASPVPWSAF